MAAADSTVLVIGLCGLGVVGNGVAQMIATSPSIRMKRILVQDKEKPRDNFTVPSGCELTTDYQHVIKDPEINCVIEVMGGTTDAWSVVSGAIAAGKHVVTANKTLISARMKDINALLKKHRVHFFYEAAVCGGIPVINAIRRGMACDKVSAIWGIMNGTTNFILSSMHRDKLDYPVAIKAAQDSGFAEADPTADVEGGDARSKLCILSKLCYGLTADEQKVYCQGITRVSDVDFAYAQMVGHTIKLVAYSRLHPETNSVDMYVAPAMVPLADPMANVHGEGNVVTVNSQFLGKSSLVGPGAGRFPSANSVVADVYELKALLEENPKGEARMPFPDVASSVTMNEDFTSCFYLRLVVDDTPGIIAKVAGLLAKEEISIFSILQTPITDYSRVPFAIITLDCKVSKLKKVSQYMNDHRKEGEEYAFLRDDPYFFVFYPDPL